MKYTQINTKSYKIAIYLKLLCNLRANLWHFSDNESLKGHKMLKEITEVLAHFETQIYEDFERIVNINSFSDNPKGISEVHDALLEIAQQIGVSLETVYSKEKKRPHLSYNKMLEKDFYAMVGHFDTVHPPQSDFQTMWEDGDKLRGPGTNDMKSGVIVALYSLSILQTLFPKTTLPLKALFNSDEEIGSLDSEAIIRDIFVGAKAGFVFEPGRLEGNSVVTARKGIFGMVIEIIGKPAHSGVEPWNGINAIVEASHIVIALEALNDYDNGISVGCNKIEGGIAANVVAPHCTLMLDARYIKPEQEAILVQAIETILKAPTVTGATIQYSIKHGRPPLVKTEASGALYQSYRAVSESLGIACGEMATGGVSDANYLSNMGIPVIDAVGAVGDNSHTKQEYIIKHSILDRIKIFTLLMAEKIGAKA